MRRILAFCLVLLFSFSMASDVWSAPTALWKNPKQAVRQCEDEVAQEVRDIGRSLEGFFMLLNIPSAIVRTVFNIIKGVTCPALVNIATDTPAVDAVRPPDAP